MHFVRRNGKCTELRWRRGNGRTRHGRTRSECWCAAIQISLGFRLYHLFAPGAVTGLRDIKHAVSVARLVMEKSEHVLIAGPGANRFAADHGVPRLEPGALITEFEKQCLEDVKNSIKG